MNPNFAKKTALTALCLVAACAPSFSATYTWKGDGGDGNWSTASNWEGDVAPNGGGHLLQFSGVNQLSAINDSRLTSISGINFDADAGAFTLGGTALTLTGSVVNNSGNTQTLGIDMTLSAQRDFDTGAGGIVVTGAMTSTATNRGISKYGSGILELRGNNTYLGQTIVYRGTLVLDASTGGFGNSSRVYFGDSTKYEIGNSSALVIKGADYTFANALASYNQGTNLVKADGVSFTAGAFATGSQATTRFDVSSPGSSVSFTTTPALTAGRLVQTVVTDGTGKTGFATVDTANGNKVVRLTGLGDLSTNPSTTTNSHVFLGGSYNNTQTDRNMNSLTLQGAAGGTVTGLTLRPREILMEEGTGDYTFEGRVNPNIGSYQLFLHQYSTDGVLRFNSTLMLDDATAGISKAGPGTVHIGSSSTSTYVGATLVQSGTLLLDGALTKTAVVTVYDKAILNGGGVIGSVANNTAATIRSGGTLGGRSSSALSFTGTLGFETDSNFSMTLDGSVTDYVDVIGGITLNDGVNLQLALEAAPVIDESMLLLKGSTLTGTFASINGSAFDPDGGFSLDYNSLTYQFRIFYENSEVRVQALSVIPEPTVSVLAGVAAAALLMSRRRRGTRPA